MKLKRISNRAGQKYNIRSYISIRKNGLIVISCGAARRMGLKVGDRIEFFQDDDRKMDWYIRKSEDGGILLRSVGRDLDSVQFNSSAIASDICRSLGYGIKDMRIPVANSPVENGMYALLTVSTL